MALLFTLSNFAFAALAVRLSMRYEADHQPRMAWASIALAAILCCLATWAACDLITGLSV